MNHTQTAIAVALALAVVGAFFFFPGFLPFTSSAASQPAAVTVPITTTTQPATSTMPIDNNGQLQSTDEVVGTGDTAEPGDTVTVNYVGTFTNGQIFDASASHPQTANGFSFTLGAGQVIPGWDQGVVGMKVGGKRQLVVPPSLGYGAHDYGPIPGNSTLVFQIELLKVQKGSGSGQ